MVDTPIAAMPPVEEEKIYPMAGALEVPFAGKVLDQRTFQYHIALGEDSPGPEQLKIDLGSGNETPYQETLSANEMKKRADASRSLVQTAVENEEPIDPLLVASIANIGSPPEKAGLVEGEYFKKVTDLLMQAGDNSETEKVYRENPMGLDEKWKGLEDIGWKNLIVGTWKGKLDEEHKQMGWGSYLGSVGMQMLWYPSYANIVGNTPEGPQSSSYWSATALDEKVQYIYSLPPVEMDKAIRAEVEALSAVNKLDAEMFVNALASYSASDIDMNTFNDVSIIPVGWAAWAGKAVKGAAGEIKAARNIAEATRAAKQSGMATEGLADAVQAAKASQATTPAEGAAKAATGAPKTVWEVDGARYESTRAVKSKIEQMSQEQTKRDTLLGDKAALEEYAAKREISPEEMRKLLSENFNEADITLKRLNGIIETDDFKAMEAAEKQAASGVKFTDISNPLENELNDITRAAASTTDIETALSGTGKPKEASEYVLRSEAAAKAVPENRTVQRQFADMLKRVSSFMNPKVKTNIGDNFFAGRLSETEDVVAHYARTIAEINNLLNVSRLPEAAYNKAVDLTEAWMKHRYPHLEDQVLDVETILPGASKTGVGQRKWYVGDKAKVPFTTPEEAQANIMWLGLPADSVGVVPNGKGYAIEVWSNVGEDKVFDDLLTPENQMVNRNSGLVMSTLRGWAGSRTQTSEFQSMIRNTAVQSEAKLRSIVNDLYQPYKDLSIREKKALNKVMRQNQLELAVPGDPTSRGKYYQTGDELNRAYFRHTRRLPTKAESDAYFRMKFANDIHWVMSNKILYKLKASQSVEQVTVSRMIEGGAMGNSTFEGRIIYPKDFPLNSNHNIDFIFRDESGIVSKLNLKNLSPKAREEIQKAIDNGYHIVQPWNKNDGEVLRFGTTEDPVNFIIAPDVSAKPLNLSKQVNYRPGWHTQYKSRWFIKQPEIQNGKYRGDVSILGFDTEKQMRKWGPVLENARKLYAAGKLGELDTYIKTSKLPFSTAKFTDTIMARLDKDVPFSFVEHAKKSPDQEFVDGSKWADRYGDVDTESEKLYDMSHGLVDPFVAPRDPTLFTIKNTGTEDAPLYEAAEATMVDPMASQTKAMGSLIQSEFYNDYQMSSAQQWLKSFENNLYVGNHKVTPEEMRRSPLYFLKHAEVRGDQRLQKQAAQTKAAIMELVGQPSKISEDVEYFRHKFVTPLVEKYLGEKYVEWIPDGALAMVTNPVHYLRAAAFHVKLGMLNPVQFFVQGAAVSNIVALHPQYGMQSFVPSTMFRFARGTEDEAVLAAMGAKVETASAGAWTKEMFVDSLKAYRKTGMDDIGSTAFKDHDGAPKLFQSKTVGMILDKGPVFFNSAEKVLRVTGWNTAYKKFITKNPSKLGKLNEYDIAKIKDEAQAMAGNMTRDSNAWWQNNSFTSLFTQFQSYNARLLELMTGLSNGQQFTFGERMRLVTAQAGLWGVPYGASAMYAIQHNDPSVLNPFAEDLQIHARNNGINLEDSTINAIYRGLVSTTYGWMSGDDYDFGDRYGMSTPRFIDNLKRNQTEYGDLNGILVSALGPSGSVVASIFKNSGNVYNGLSDLVTQSGTEGGTLPADTSALLNEFGGPKAIVKLLKAGAAIYHGTGMDARMPNGKLLKEDADPLGEAVRTLLGVEDVEVTDAYKQLAQDRRDQSDHQAVLKQAQKYMGIAMQAWADGDGEKADKMRKYVRAYLTARNFQPNEIASVIWPGGKYNKDFAESVYRDHTKKIKDIATKSNWFDFLERSYGDDN